MRRFSLLSFALLIVLLVAPRLSASEAPLGHQDFYPSPERPVGFRGDGNGFFPGADPVTTFREGTAETIQVTIRDRKGRDKKQKLWAFTDSQAVNICWKTEMPGWANAMPIVVGNRVFTMAEPHTLVCVDASTGEILWQRANNPFLFDGVPAAKAEQLQELLYLARASFQLSRLVTPGRWGSARKYDPRSAEGHEMLTKAIANLKQMQATAQGIDAGLAAAFDPMVAAFQQWMTDGHGDSPKAPNDFAEAVGKTFQIPPTNQWTSMTGFTMPVPVSDGRHVFATIGQGQAVCYDLDGQLVWGRVFKGTHHLRVHHVASPLLIGDLFVGQFFDKLRALDKATGKTVWEADLSIGGGYNAGSHKHLRLADRERTVDVIVTTFGVVLRAADGKVLGKLPFHHGKEGGGPSIIGQGDVIVFEKRQVEGQKKGKGYWRGRLLLEGETVDLIDIQPLEGREKESGGPPATPILADGRIIAGSGVWDLATGKALRASKRSRDLSRVGWASGVMVGGDRVILAYDGSSKGYSRDRPDGLTVMNFRVYDLSAREGWKVLSDGNVLGGVNKPHFVELERHAPMLVEADRYSNYGLPPQFGCYNSGGIFPQGNRLFIRSVSHLYCIGDPSVPFSGRTAGP